RDPDLQVHVGAVATGKMVEEDPELFPRLRRVVRKTIGVEMEGVAIGSLAQHFDRKGLVVKAVSDHADLKKDDSFREFACKAAATVLMAFLQSHLVSQAPIARGEDEDDDTVVDSPYLDRIDGAHFGEDRYSPFLARVERVALLRDP